MTIVYRQGVSLSPGGYHMISQIRQAVERKRAAVILPYTVGSLDQGELENIIIGICQNLRFGVVEVEIKDDYYSQQKIDENIFYFIHK